MVETNAEGLRDWRVARDDSGGKILLLGDSFAFGWGVQLPETFGARTEDALSPARVRVIKAGIPGTGTGDQADWLARYGDTWRPSLVLLALFVGNDFVDVQMGGARAQYIVRDGLMEKKPFDSDARTSWTVELKDRLKRSSLVAQRAAQAVWVLERRFHDPEGKNPGLTAGDRWLWEFFKIHLRQLPPETASAIRQTTEALERMAAWCDARGLPLAVMVIPPSHQVYDWQLLQTKKAYKLSDDDLDLDRPQRVLTEWGRGRGVAVLDLAPGFRQYAAAHPRDRLYFYPNGHFNARGHEVATAQLVAFLRAHGLPPRPGGTSITAVKRNMLE